MSWEFSQQQVDVVAEALPIMRDDKLVYIACEERTRKTGMAILLTNQLGAKRVLILTKAVAVEDWNNQLSKYHTEFKYHVSSYHSVKKAPSSFDLVILDEAHNYISGSPKIGSMWKDVYKKVYGAPIVYISATPHAQGYQMLYHQFKLSKHGNPWSDYANFYRWYEVYAERDEAGNTETVWLHNRRVDTYKSLQNDKIKDEVDKLFVTRTRKELGFEHEPQDKVHYINLSAGITTAIRLLIKDKVLKFSLNEVSYTYLADTVAGLRSALHQLEGGTLIVRPNETDLTIKKSLILQERSKIDYILKEFGDSDNMVIMYNFKAEKGKLEAVFKNALVVQATRNAEGVDYSHKEHLIIYSQDYSTARHTQRRARQASKDREKEIVVHHLLVDKGLSQQVYTTVCLNKKNFVDSRFIINEIGV